MKAEDELIEIYNDWADDFWIFYRRNREKRIRWKATRKVQLDSYRKIGSSFWKLKCRIDDYKKQILTQDKIINKLREENKQQKIYVEKLKKIHNKNIKEIDELKEIQEDLIKHASNLIQENKKLKKENEKLREENKHLEEVYLSIVNQK